MDRGKNSFSLNGQTTDRTCSDHMSLHTLTGETVNECGQFDCASSNLANLRKRVKTYRGEMKKQMQPV